MSSISSELKCSLTLICLKDLATLMQQMEFWGLTKGNTQLTRQNDLSLT